MKRHFGSLLRLTLIKQLNVKPFLSNLRVNALVNSSARLFCLSNNLLSNRAFTSNMEDKTISFDSYDVIGFDCDHTIAQYNLYNLFKDTYDDMASYLIKEMGYRKELFHFYPNFCSRGIILDLETGNFMKLAHDGSILRAFHGTTPLPKHEYAFQVWPHYEELSSSMTNIGKRFRIFENFFDMASSLLCAQIIDELDRKHNNNPPSYNVWPDVVKAIQHVYIPDPFRAQNGMFFSKWIKDTGRYIDKCSDKMKNWLKIMKQNNGKGRPMFILTSAYEDFAAATLKYVLGEQWEEYFDFFIFLAEKPMFFYKNEPFYHISACNKEMVVDQLKGNKKTHGGNLTELNKHLQLITGKQNPKVLFFGDSQRSDIIPSKRFAKWDTVFILEEMTSEQCFYEYKEDKLSIQSSNFKCKQDMPWGSVFIDDKHQINGEYVADDDSTAKETMVHHVTKTYADIAVPNMQFILDYPLDHKFRTFNASKHPSTSGFHPFIPEALTQIRQF